MLAALAAAEAASLVPVWVAAVGIIPATLAAILTYRTAKQSKKQLTPSNGKTVAQMVEDTEKLARQNHDQLIEFGATLRSHIADQRAHAIECHAHHIDAAGVCPNCGAIT